MKKQKYSRIIGVISILILVASLIVIPQVFAIEYEEEEEMAEAGTCSDPTYKFGVYIVQEEDDNGNNQYVLRRSRNVTGQCGPESDGFDPLVGDLKITSVSGIGSIAVGQTISMNDEITLGGDSLLVTFGNKSSVQVILEKVTEESAGNGNVLEGILGGLIDGYTSSITVKFSIVQEDAVNSQIDTSHLDTVNSATGTSQTATTPEFEAIFNDIYTKAQNAGHAYVEKGHDIPTTILDELKCSKDIKDASGNVIDRTTNYYQERNSGYFYASQTTQGDSLTYIYNYAPGEPPATQTTPHVCEKTCEEAVKVEYGMPVASKAGLCFEYKVKVSSYVKCRTTTTASAPQRPTGSYCDPAPKCYSAGGTLRRLPQAGPTEDFDSCISECDGGKYSEKCSLKCYKQVYGKNPKSKLSINYEDYAVQKLANTEDDYSLEDCLEDNKDYYGCYYKSGGKMLWASYRRNQSGETGVTYNRSDLGRWYIDTGYDIWNLGDNDGNICNPQTALRCYVADTQGILRRNYRNSGLCDDVCSWRTDQCSGQYLNPGTALKDYEDNVNRYNAAVNSCAAAASCSTSTAEFTISVDYTDKDTGTRETVSFPYSTDKLSSRGATTIVRTSSNADSTIIDYAGCYKDTGADNEYMTEWGFPGSWIHNKTGDVVYDNPNDTIYHFESGKYCLPLNAKEVNGDWWEYSETDNGCYVGVPSPDEWNISAETNKFGYFGWNIKMKCFYAIRNKVCDLDINGCCINPGGPGGPGGPTITPPTEESTVINYRIRSVDLNDLFPNEGTRETGFNWTSAATIPASKDAKYAVDPEVLKNEIEAKGIDGTYQDSELDYSFTLTPELLRKIRHYNKSNGYDKFEGTISTAHDRSVNSYTSNILTPYYVDAFNRHTTLGTNNS